MTTSHGDADARVAELRSAFDRSFAEAPITKTAAVETLLGISVTGRPYAIRMNEIAGIFAGMRITSLPSPVPSLRGIAGLRGAILPVYDLGVLLGLARSTSPRWLAVTSGTALALAFDSFDGYLTARPDDLVAASTSSTGRHVREVLRTDVTMSLIDVPAIIHTLHVDHDRKPNS